VDLLTLMQARQRRDDGIALVEDSESSRWQQHAIAVIAELAQDSHPFTSDDVCDVVGRPTHPAAVGALMMRAVRSGRLERVGAVQSTRVLARGRWLPAYVGVRT
jgi:hypothetical protein